MCHRLHTFCIVFHNGPAHDLHIVIRQIHVSQQFDVIFETPEHAGDMLQLAIDLVDFFRFHIVTYITKRLAYAVPNALMPN